MTLKRGQNIKYLPFAFTEHGAIIGWWPTFTVSSLQATGLIQSISVFFNTSFDDVFVFSSSLENCLLSVVY